MAFFNCPRVSPPFSYNVLPEACCLGAPPASKGLGAPLSSFLAGIKRRHSQHLSCAQLIPCQDAAG